MTKSSINIRKLRDEALDVLHRAGYAESQKALQLADAGNDNFHGSVYWSGYCDALKHIATYLIDYRQGIDKPAVNHRAH